MKKFTIISLMLALVASFVFATGLTPYFNSSNGVRMTNAVDATFDEDGLTLSAYDLLRLNSVVFNGSAVVGLKDASGLFDINGTLDAVYYAGKTSMFTKENAVRTEIDSEDDTLEDYFDLVVTENDGTTGGPRLVFVPSLNAEYYGDNLKTNVSLSATLPIYNSILKLYKEADSMFMGKSNVEADVDVLYATNLKNSSNIFKFGFGQDFVLNADGTTSTTEASASFYIPKAGTSVKDTMGKYFDSKVKAYQFRAYINGSFAFGSRQGSYINETATETAKIGLDYFKYFEGGFFNANGYVYGKFGAKSKGTIKTAANIEYKKTEVKGANAMDKLVTDLKAGFASNNSKVTLSSSASVSIPRLIPVELYDNISANLPMTFKASSVYTAKADNPCHLAFDITAYPFYIEFKDGAYSLFDKKLETLTLYTKYGNETDFSKWSSRTDHNFNYSTGINLGLADAEIDFNLVFVEHNDTEATATSSAGVGLVTLSYTAEY